MKSNESSPSLNEIRKRRETLFPAAHDEGVWKGPIFNQDSTEFFATNPPDAMSGELIDSYIDLLAYAGIGTFISCVNAQRVNYASGVWQTDWEGYDPAGAWNQPMLCGLPEEIRELTRSRFDALVRLAELGIDFHQRAFERCRLHGITTCISIRMNDVHECTEPDSPFLSSFYVRHRAEGKLRAPYRQQEQWWSEFTLDWELPEVRDHYLKLIIERLEQDDLDVLELDWMRFVYHFRPGRELRGGKILTEWLRKVRVLCDRAGERLGRRVLLAARVPADPQTARRCGLDALAWAREGLADVVIPSHFCATTDFDLPIETWRAVLPPEVRLAGSIDNISSAIPNERAIRITPRQTLGAAANLLHAGADTVYLFNFFPTSLTLLQEWTLDEFFHSVSAVRRLDTIIPHPRSQMVTYRDHYAPGEPAASLLPAQDLKVNMPWPPGCLIRLRIGPRPEEGTTAALQLTFSTVPESWEQLSVYMNGRKLSSPEFVTDSVALHYLPIDWMEEEVQVFEFVSAGAFVLVGVDLDLTPQAHPVSEFPFPSSFQLRPPRSGEVLANP